MKAAIWVGTLLAALLGVPLLYGDCCPIPLLNSGPGPGTVVGPGGVGPGGAGVGSVGTTTGDDLLGSSGAGALDPNLLGGSEGLAYADGARSLFSEPNQWGVIAWNGKEEILVLKTEEKSLLGKGAVLHFMPLPGKPIDVKKGDPKLYEKAFDLVQRKVAADLPGRNVVVLERKIGAHNIFVWRIDNINEFTTRVQAYAKKRFGNKAVALFTKDTERVIHDYFRRGFKYFAFDLCIAEDKNAEKMAIEYHFESKFAYYPMVVSHGAGSGPTRVELVVFTPPEGVNANVGKLTFADKDNKNGDIMTLGKKSVLVSGKEMAALHPGMAALFQGKEVRARIWVVEGRLDQIPGDIMAFHKQ